uniref:Uncharacterized protein n=1 Tax=Takifugu rubripes TaxID=31033 RepID=A0A674PBD1_TAKRU
LPLPHSLPPSLSPPPSVRNRGDDMACSSLSILLMCLLSVDGQTGGAERIKLTFTPTTCTVHCFQRQCVNYCKQGNVTTLYSGEGGAASKFLLTGRNFIWNKRWLVSCARSPVHGWIWLWFLD